MPAADQGASFGSQAGVAHVVWERDHTGCAVHNSLVDEVLCCLAQFSPHALFFYVIAFHAALADAGYDAGHNHCAATTNSACQTVIALNPATPLTDHPRRLTAARSGATSRPRSITSAGTPRSAFSQA